MFMLMSHVSTTECRVAIVTNVVVVAVVAVADVVAAPLASSVGVVRLCRTGRGFSSSVFDLFLFVRCVCVCADRCHLIRFVVIEIGACDSRCRRRNCRHCRSIAASSATDHQAILMYCCRSNIIIVCLQSNQKHKRLIEPTTTTVDADELRRALSDRLERQPSAAHRKEPLPTIYHALHRHASSPATDANFVALDDDTADSNSQDVVVCCFRRRFFSIVRLHINVSF